MTSKQRTLEKRVAVVTGASSGIGLAVAEHFVELGARVVINARRRDRLEEIAARLNRVAKEPVVVIAPGDASDPSVIRSMFERAEQHRDAGGLGAPADLCVINAGRGLAGSVATSDPMQWEEMIRTNLLGAARLLREASDRMLALEDIPEGERGERGGWLRRARDIVLLGSTVGRHISPFSSMYGSTKFAVHALAEGARRELGPKGLRVSLIEPAIVESEFQQVAGYEAESFGAFMRRIGPVLQPEDVARMIGFVVSQPAHVHVADVLVRPTRQDYP